MDEIGGHSLTIAVGGRVHVCTVANKNRAEAVRLALAHIGDGKVTWGAELWESEISALHMRPNDVTCATAVTPERKS